MTNYCHSEALGHLRRHKERMRQSEEQQLQLQLAKEHFSISSHFMPIRHWALTLICLHSLSSCLSSFCIFSWPSWHFFFSAILISHLMLHCISLQTIVLEMVLFNKTRSVQGRKLEFRSSEVSAKVIVFFFFTLDGLTFFHSLSLQLLFSRCSYQSTRGRKLEVKHCSA